MTKIVYKIADSGEAQNLRFSPDKLALESGEIELPFTDKLPDIETLHEKKWLDHLASIEYKTNRSKEYPPMQDYLDAIVKDDQAQIDKYIADCKAVKAKYPKE